MGLSHAFWAGWLASLTPPAWMLWPLWAAVVTSVPLGGRLYRWGWVSAGFFAGFGVLFVSFQSGAPPLGSFLFTHSGLLSVAAGIGVLLIGFRRSARDWGGAPSQQHPPHPLGFWVMESIWVGGALGLLWYPCDTPMLGTILLLSAVEETLRQGVGLLSGYVAGLVAGVCLWGFLMRLLFTKLFNVDRPRTWALALTGVGLLMATGIFSWFSRWLVTAFQSLWERAIPFGL